MIQFETNQIKPLKTQIVNFILEKNILIFILFICHSEKLLQFD